MTNVGTDNRTYDTPEVTWSNTLPGRRAAYTPRTTEIVIHNSRAPAARLNVTGIFSRINSVTGRCCR